jgi:hypothetical protein
MKLTKKLVKTLLTATLIFTGLLITNKGTVQADDIIISPTTCSSAEELESVLPQINYTWQTDGNTSEEYVAKFTLLEDSLLYVKSSQIYSEDATIKGGRLGIYSDRTFQTNVISMTSDATSAYKFVPAGTYYVRIYCESNTNGVIYNTPTSVSAAISKIPFSKVLTWTTEINSSKSIATITFTNHIGSLLSEVRITGQDYTEKDLNYGNWDKTSKLVFDENGNATYIASRNSNYTMRVATYVSFWEVSGILETLKISDLDSTAPTVSGVKQETKYYKAVTIKVSDKESGVNTVLLNGTKMDVSEMQKGYTINKDGVYFLTVTDKCANSKMIVFTVKLDKTKPTVTGVKNKKTYTKAVTIKASDADSGLKSATLNGKTIKISKLTSGYKVSKNGTYTLKVTDKVGNTTTIKFTIKIKETTKKTSK